MVTAGKGSAGLAATPAHFAVMNCKCIENDVRGVQDDIQDMLPTCRPWTRGITNYEAVILQNEFAKSCRQRGIFHVFVQAREDDIEIAAQNDWRSGMAPTHRRQTASHGSPVLNAILHCVRARLWASAWLWAIHAHEDKWVTRLQVDEPEPGLPGNPSWPHALGTR